MPHDYAPKLFLRQVENALLKEYFTTRGELADIDWDNPDVDQAYAAWQSLSEEKHEDIEQDFPRRLRSGFGGRDADAH